MTFMITPLKGGFYNIFSSILMTFGSYQCMHLFYSNYFYKTPTSNERFINLNVLFDRHSAYQFQSLPIIKN